MGGWLKIASGCADTSVVGSVLVLVAVVIGLGVAVGGWAVIRAGGAADDALERDEANISRGRQPGAKRH